MVANKFHNFKQISQYRINFTISNKFHNIEPISLSEQWLDMVADMKVDKVAGMLADMFKIKCSKLSELGRSCLMQSVPD